MQVSKEQIKAARLVNLRNFLNSNYPCDLKNERSGWSSLKRDEKIRIKEGYKNMQTGERGNAIDFMMQYKKMSFPDAVAVLAGCLSPVSVNSNLEHVEKDQPEERELPERSKSDYSVKKYLVGRGIDCSLLDRLFSIGLIYQDSRKNCVFVNHNRDYAEIRASNEIPTKKTGKPFRDNIVNGGYCWYMYLGEDPQKGYICESAIDAISLAQILKESAYYFSVGGCGQKERIKRVAALSMEIILAVDADQAGERCRQEHAELPAIIPENAKDWNEIIQKGERTWHDCHKACGGHQRGKLNCVSVMAGSAIV